MNQIPYADPKSTLSHEAIDWTNDLSHIFWILRKRHWSGKFGYCFSDISESRENIIPLVELTILFECDIEFGLDWLLWHLTVMINKLIYSRAQYMDCSTTICATKIVTKTCLNESPLQLLKWAPFIVWVGSLERRGYKMLLLLLGNGDLRLSWEFCVPSYNFAHWWCRKADILWSSYFAVVLYFCEASGLGIALK